MTRHISTTIGCVIRRSLSRITPGDGEDGASAGGGGKSDRRGDDLSRDLVDEQLGVKPGADRVVSKVGQLIEPSDRFFSLDFQLYLPPEPVERENLLRREALTRDG